MPQTLWITVNICNRSTNGHRATAKMSTGFWSNWLWNISNLLTGHAFKNSFMIGYPYAQPSTCIYQYPVPYLSAIEQRPVAFPWVPASISANSLLQITTTAPKSTSEVLHWPAFIPASLAWFEFYMTTILPGQTTWFLSQCLPNLVPWPKMPRLGTTILWLNCILMVLLHWPP